ncbi:MAG TPA: LytTR family DNA-binding domain-containing protein [Flavisolibacter sp.]|jgi:DNA-binding LytR/AlgR family response regulator|nr:LytTR family DNA-binding domain-containing protein [Flavisolibacter sp.]
MKVLIIEDEELGIERLTKHLNSIDPSIEIVGATGSITDSVQWFHTNPHPDIVLMDIELSDGQSFAIFNEVDIKSTVIFTTSYDEFALKAFKVNSIDYLLKPIKKEDLRNSLDKYHQLKQQYAPSPSVQIETLLSELKLQQKKTYRNRFLVKQGQRLVSIESTDIAYFYAEGRLCFFKTWNKAKYIVDYTLDELEEMLDPQAFYRANRGFIVQVKSIAQIQTHFNGKLLLELEPATEKEVVISREKASEFKEWLGK